MKELLSSENLLEAAADALLERIGLRQRRVDLAPQGHLGQRPGLNAEGAREEGHLPPAARHRRIDGLGPSGQATGQRGEVGRGNDDVPAALRVGLELVPSLASTTQRSRHDHHRIPFQYPPGRVAQQAIRQVAVGRWREEPGFVVEVRRVLVSGIEQVEHRVGQIVARLVGEVAPRAVDGAPVHVPRDGPSGIEVEEQRHGRVHDPGLAMGLDPALGGLLDLADGSELLVREPAALEADRDAVGEDVRVEQTLHQAEAGAERWTVRVAAGRRVIGLVAPAIEDRDVAEPRHTVLLARAPDERVSDLVIRQGLGRFRAQEGEGSFLEQIVAEVQCHQRRVLVAEIVAHPFEVPLEVEILLEAIDRSGRHLPRVGADIPPVLFADIRAQPAVPQRGLEGVQRGGGRDELLPEPPRPRPRHVAADVEKI